MTERLTCCAIERDGVIHSEGGWREHWRLRAALGDDNPCKRSRGDIDGFMTSTGRFVGRREANAIADESGQCQRMQREMLSSDIDWDAKPPRQSVSPSQPGYKSPYRRKMFRP